MPDNSHRTRAISRRGLLRAGGIAAAATASGARPRVATAQKPPTGQRPGHEERPAAFPLKFRPDGKFTLVQFNDTQDDHLTDRRTIEFMGRVLDEVRPDFALINGDVITSGPSTPTETYQAVNNVVLPMESRGIPWAITFGNHDEDSATESGTGVYEKELADWVRQYHHNLNPEAGSLPYGHSDTRLLVASSDGRSPRFALWLVDSGSYLTDLGEHLPDSIPEYDYIRPEQISWYIDLSKADEERYKKKIPGLMFFHIPTYEHRDMWFGGPARAAEHHHAEAVPVHGIDGVKNEDVYYGSFNSGIFGAVRDRGDVLGIYCGHDHINSYHGTYFGVELGYCPGTGFGAYGLRDGTPLMHTLRGARVFELNEKSERIYERTSLIFAKDMGISMDPRKHPLSRPEPIPDYVTVPEHPRG